jgi:hypothetical protein
MYHGFLNLHSTLCSHAFTRLKSEIAHWILILFHALLATHVCIRITSSVVCVHTNSSHSSLPVALVRLAHSTVYFTAIASVFWPNENYLNCDPTMWFGHDAVSLCRSCFIKDKKVIQGATNKTRPIYWCFARHAVKSLWNVSVCMLYC